MAGLPWLPIGKGLPGQPFAPLKSFHNMRQGAKAWRKRPASCGRQVIATLLLENTSRRSRHRCPVPPR